MKKVERLFFLLCFISIACEPSLPDYNLKNDYSLSLFLKKASPSSQGMAIFDDRVFIIEAGGQCQVYDYQTREYITSFALGSSSIFNHCNCANWGTEIPDNASFPLLYVTNGQFGAPTEWHCKVELIRCNGLVFSSECVQTIILDTSHFKDRNLLVPWGCPQWLVDRENGYLWVWSANIRTLPFTTGSFANNLYHATKFKIPLLSEGEVVVLTAEDVLEQVPFEFDAFSTQGGCIYNGQIIYSFGFGNDNSPSKIRVYDTTTGTITKRINLKGVLDVELEDVAVYNKRLYLNTNTYSLYEINLNEVLNN